jgi:predicted ATPase
LRHQLTEKQALRWFLYAESMTNYIRYSHLSAFKDATDAHSADESDDEFVAV